MAAEVLHDGQKLFLSTDGMQHEYYPVTLRRSVGANGVVRWVFIYDGGGEDPVELVEAKDGETSIESPHWETVKGE